MNFIICLHPKKESDKNKKNLLHFDQKFMPMDINFYRYSSDPAVIYQERDLVHGSVQLIKDSDGMVKAYLMGLGKLT